MCARVRVRARRAYTGEALRPKPVKILGSSGFLRPPGDPDGLRFFKALGLESMEVPLLHGASTHILLCEKKGLGEPAWGAIVVARSLLACVQMTAPPPTDDSYGAEAYLTSAATTVASASSTAATAVLDASSVAASSVAAASTTAASAVAAASTSAATSVASAFASLWGAAPAPEGPPPLQREPKPLPSDPEGLRKLLSDPKVLVLPSDGEAYLRVRSDRQWNLDVQGAPRHARRGAVQGALLTRTTSAIAVPATEGDVVQLVKYASQNSVKGLVRGGWGVNWAVPAAHFFFFGCAEAWGHVWPPLALLQHRRFAHH